MTASSGTGINGQPYKWDLDFIPLYMAQCKEKCNVCFTVLYKLPKWDFFTVYFLCECDNFFDTLLYLQFHVNIIITFLAVHLQIEEISRKLRSGDLGIPPNPEDRCDSMSLGFPVTLSLI